jgi:hypothetical protein
LIEVRVRHRQQQIGGARTERGDHHARLAFQLSIDRGGNSGVRFVPHQDKVDAGLPQLVDQDEHLTARKTEGPFDASIRQGLRYRRRRRRHCGVILVERIGENDL